MVLDAAESTFRGMLSRRATTACDDNQSNAQRTRRLFFYAGTKTDRQQTSTIWFSRPFHREV